MTDLTAITTPFGLLDRETQEALRAHGGPLEHWTGLGWHLSSDPDFASATTYRAKPAPAEPREWWIVGMVVYASKSKAESFRAQLDEENPTMGFGPIIHVREVLS